MATNFRNYIFYGKFNFWDTNYSVFIEKQVISQTFLLNKIGLFSIKPYLDKHMEHRPTFLETTTEFLKLTLFGGFDTQVQINIFILTYLWVTNQCNDK